LEEKALRKVFKYEEKEYDVEMNKTKNKYCTPALTLLLDPGSTDTRSVFC
jgi:hypothetical protein